MISVDQKDRKAQMYIHFARQIHSSILCTTSKDFHSRLATRQNTALGIHRDEACP